MTQTQSTLRRIEEILPQLPLPQLEMVLTFTDWWWLVGRAGNGWARFTTRYTGRSLSKGSI